MILTLLSKLGEKFVSEISKLRVNLRKPSQELRIESPRLASSDQSRSLYWSVVTYQISTSNRLIKSEN